MAKMQQGHKRVQVDMVSPLAGLVTAVFPRKSHCTVDSCLK